MRKMDMLRMGDHGRIDVTPYFRGTGAGLGDGGCLKRKVLEQDAPSGRTSRPPGQPLQSTMSLVMTESCSLRWDSAGRLAGIRLLSEALAALHTEHHELCRSQYRRRRPDREEGDRVVGHDDLFTREPSKIDDHIDTLGRG